MSRKLIFEGAGWDKAESCGDVGNCRIRTTFKNKRGSEIYLELTAHKPHRWSITKMKPYAICGVVDHVFYKQDESTGYSANLSQLHKLFFEWSKANILALVNSHDLGGEFDSIEVRDDWNGFNITGEVES